MAVPGFRPRALGEIAIRCRDLDAMADFYGRVLRLERLQPSERGGHREGLAFFRLGESHAGHIAVLALFADGEAPAPGGALHHLALALPWDEQEAAVDWLTAQGCEARTVLFDWTGWRGIFTRDPEGNTVELVAADPAWHLT